MKLATACLAAALLATSLMVGCDTTRPPGAATPDPLSAAAYPQIAALGRLDDYLSFDKPVVTTAPESPMTVVTPVRLRSDEEVSAQYRYIFFDKSGAPLRQQAEWRFITLPSRSQVFLRGTSFEPAADWRLEIRPAR